MHGDALTLLADDGRPITFAEWGYLGKGKFQRRDFRFEALTQMSSFSREGSLWAHLGNHEVFTPIKAYPPMNVHELACYSGLKRHHQHAAEDFRISLRLKEFFKEGDGLTYWSIKTAAKGMHPGNQYQLVLSSSTSGSCLPDTPRRALAIETLIRTESSALHSLENPAPSLPRPISASARSIQRTRQRVPCRISAVG